MSVKFIQEGFSLDSLTREQPDQIFHAAVYYANQALKREQVEIFFKRHIPEELKEPKTPTIDYKRNILLGIKHGGQESLIDMIDIKALDEKSIKPAEFLAGEMVQKVRQHLLAQKTEGIVISLLGTKFDTRRLPHHNFRIDEQGYVRIDNKRLAASAHDGCWVVKAEHLNSYTIIRLIEEGPRIRMFDNYDLRRSDNRGMVIDPTKAKCLKDVKLTQSSQEDLENYHGKYVHLEQDELTAETRKSLYAILRTFPTP